MALAVGWLRRDDGVLTPEHGTGYWLGIAGASAMLMLLVYPLRKRVRALAMIGSIPFWFRTHMVLGLVGPLLILYHANFKLGSMNSNVALVSMLVVASSGLVGRYLYGKIHYGLDGVKADVDDILRDADDVEAALGSGLPYAEELIARLDEFRDEALRPRASFLGGVVARLSLGAKSRRLKREIMAEAREIIEADAHELGHSRGLKRRRLAAVKRHLAQFFAAVRRAAAFAVYERLFAAWHVLHLPLFLLLILTTVLHVIAVHTY
jgi:hypothetical protein